jgi:glutaredoxin-like YruB-family protein
VITVYTTPTCAFCHGVKEYLRQKKVEFAEKDLTIDQSAVKWVLDKTGQLAVPVIDLNGTVIIGFDRPKIDAALKS